MAEYPHACNGTISTFYNFLSTFYDIPSTKMTLLKVHDILATFLLFHQDFRILTVLVHFQCALKTLGLPVNIFTCL